MSPFVWVLLGIFSLFLLVGMGLRMGKILKKRGRTRLLKTIRLLLPEALVSFSEDGITDFRIETKETLMIVKWIRMDPRHELIITNPDAWCLNDDPQSWRRSSTPRLISGVASFRKIPMDSSKKTFRLALLDPGCHNVTRYLNESEVETVRWEKPIHGVHFVRLGELGDFFTLLERK